MTGVSGSATAGGAPSSSIPEKWAWHLRILTDLRSRLLGERDWQRAQASAPIDFTLNSADGATDESDRDLALAMLENKDDLLKEIEAAIQRIQRGTYGICEETGSVIPAERLLAVPWTRYCREVEEQLESERQRPVSRIPPINLAALPGKLDLNKNSASDSELDGGGQGASRTE